MNIFWALLLGVISYFVAHLVLNEVLSFLIALAVGISILFSYGPVFDRRR